jgi:hypothetical protein
MYETEQYHGTEHNIIQAGSHLQLSVEITYINENFNLMKTKP